MLYASQLGNMTLKFCTTQMLTPHSVVPLVKYNAMVINHPGSIYRPLEVLITFALIEFELQCFHATIVYHIDILVR